MGAQGKMGGLGGGREEKWRSGSGSGKSCLVSSGECCLN